MMRRGLDAEGGLAAAATRPRQDNKSVHECADCNIERYAH